MLQIIRVDYRLPLLVDLFHHPSHVRVKHRAGVREPDKPEVGPLRVGHDLHVFPPVLEDFENNFQNPSITKSEKKYPNGKTTSFLIVDHGISDEGGQLVCVIGGGEGVGGTGEEQRRHGDPVDAIVWWICPPVLDLPFISNGIFHRISILNFSV